MAMTKDEIRQRLSAIEPDSDMYAGMGADEVELLTELLDDDEAWLAARAVHALTRIGTPAASQALAAAGRSRRDEVRVAVAAAAAVLPAKAADALLEPLLSDPDVGVRKFAIRSVSAASSDAVKSRMSAIAAGDTDQALRKLASERLRDPGR